MTYEEKKVARIKAERLVAEILEGHGIRMKIGTCGCCSSPWVTFESHGAMIADNIEDFNLNMFPETDED